ncbi:MAG: ABC transporter substrate-binding protein [Hyphomicrobiales bacterium]|nr:ABC transporter substrate-binding protein [Hyphomicrobiales bacterium]
MRKINVLLLGGVALVAMSLSAAARDIKIGFSLSTTGPAAALGLPELKSIAILPKTIAGQKVDYIVLDDGGDPAKATANARKLVTEDKVDVLVGSSITPGAIAVSNVATEAGVPDFSQAPMPITPAQAKWTVVLPQPVSLMGKGVFENMKQHHVKTVGIIGYNDVWGDLWLNDFNHDGVAMGMKLDGNERFARADTSVTGQALRLIAAKPDAVLVAASGTAAALPQTALRDHGYKGLIYQTHGAVSNDFIRVAGKDAEGAILPSGPVMVAELQDDSSPTKAPGLAYLKAYEGKYGANTRTQFGAQIWDTYLILERVIPDALKAGKPGTAAFRNGIRKALLTEHNIAGSQGVYNYTATDRNGVDDRARVMLQVKDGKFAIVK